MDLRPLSVLHLTWDLERPVVYPAASVSQSVRPVHLYEKDYTDKIIEAIADPEKYVVVQTAPSVQSRAWRRIWLSDGNGCGRQDGSSAQKNRI